MRGDEGCTAALQEKVGAMVDLFLLVVGQSERGMEARPRSGHFRHDEEDQEHAEASHQK